MTFALPPLRWRASPNFSRRNGARVDLIVIHDTESGYESAIGWFANAHSQVSAHYVLKKDASEATQMVELADKAWACVAFNSRSVNLEMEGFAKAGYGEPEWQAAAGIVAFLLHHLQIPVQWARGGVGPGFCSHYDLGRAGGNHSDPTTDANVWAAFVDRVEAATRVGDFPATWDVGPASPAASPPPATTTAPSAAGSVAGAPTPWFPINTPPAAPAGPAISIGTTVPARVLRIGLSGPDVAELQQQLNLLRLAFTWANDPAGSFGEGTLSAVIAFQARSNLTEDGEVGPHTRAALADAIAALPKAVQQS